MASKRFGPTPCSLYSTCHNSEERKVTSEKRKRQEVQLTQKKQPVDPCYLTLQASKYNPFFPIKVILYPSFHVIKIQGESQVKSKNIDPM